MNNLKEQYIKEVIPALMKQFGFKNKMMVPNLKKVVINVGLGASLKDKEFVDAVKQTLEKISGQRPVETLSRKSISNFKIRIGQAIGVMVTLRGARMWDFVEKLIKVTLPRVRDFRGVPLTSFDDHGNFALGMKEYVAFPEVRQDEMDKVHGLEVCISTTAKNKEQGRALLRELGFPFKTADKDNK